MISAIDYEAMPATTFVLTVTASAGGTNSLRDLTVDIIDKPEGLSFDQAGYSVTAAEGQVYKIRSYYNTIATSCRRRANARADEKSIIRGIDIVCMLLKYGFRGV